MICCEKCFNDEVISSRIRSYKIKGNCDICGAENVFVYDTEKSSYLKELFEGLFDIYSVEGQLPEHFPIKKLNFLKHDLKVNWKLFADNLTEFNVKILIENLCPEYFQERPEILVNKVGILRFADNEYLDNNSIVGRYDWDIFVDSIKNKYRFNTDIIGKKILKEYCPFLVRTLVKGSKYYRARISSKEGYPKEKMWAPPKALATAGRVNPIGMNYLYLADTEETTLYEIRASLNDYVSIATFELKSDIKVIDLTGIDKISVFQFATDYEIDYEKHAVNREHLKKINNEIARPVRSSDSRLDYLPTQYICDFIKSIKDEFNDELQAYDGIMYKSTMIKDSYNIAIFDEEKFVCNEVKVFEVEGIKYKY